MRAVTKKKHNSKHKFLLYHFRYYWKYVYRFYFFSDNSIYPLLCAVTFEVVPLWRDQWVQQSCHCWKHLQSPVFWTLQMEHVTVLELWWCYQISSSSMCTWGSGKQKSQKGNCWSLCSFSWQTPTWFYLCSSPDKAQILCNMSHFKDKFLSLFFEICHFLTKCKSQRAHQTTSLHTTLLLSITNYNFKNNS